MSTTPMPPPKPEDGWRSSGSTANTAEPVPPPQTVTERTTTTTTGPPPDRDGGNRVWLWVLLALLLIGLLAWFLTRGGGEESTELQGATDTGSELTADQDGIGDDPAATPAEASGQDAAEAQDAGQEPMADEPAAPQAPAGGDAAQDPAAEAPAAGDPAAEEPAAQEPAAQEPPAPAPAAEDPAAQGATAQDAGSVTTADGRQLFPIDNARLPEFAGADLTGQQVLVQSVVPGQGFWIGTDETNRIFVHPDAGVPLGFEPAAGQRINFDGFLKPNPADGSADVHDIPPEHGAEQHRQQGHHIQLRSATPA